MSDDTDTAGSLAGALVFISGALITLLMLVMAVGIVFAAF